MVLSYQGDLMSGKKGFAIAITTVVLALALLVWDLVGGGERERKRQQALSDAIRLRAVCRACAKLYEEVGILYDSDKELCNTGFYPFLVVDNKSLFGGSLSVVAFEYID